MRRAKMLRRINDVLMPTDDDDDPCDERVVDAYVAMCQAMYELPPTHAWHIDRALFGWVFVAVYGRRADVRFPIQDDGTVRFAVSRDGRHNILCKQPEDAFAAEAQLAWFHEGWPNRVMWWGEHVVGVLTVLAAAVLMIAVHFDVAFDYVWVAGWCALWVSFMVAAEVLLVWVLGLAGPFYHDADASRREEWNGRMAFSLLCLSIGVALVICPDMTARACTAVVEASSAICSLVAIALCDLLVVAWVLARPLVVHAGGWLQVDVDALLAEVQFALETCPAVPTGEGVCHGTLYP